MKTFTDDDGNKYELVPYELTSKQLYKVDGELYEAKLVAKPVEKQAMLLELGFQNKSYYSEYLELADIQAQALSTAIQELIELTQMSHDPNFHDYPPTRLYSLILAARRAGQDNE